MLKREWRSYWDGRHGRVCAAVEGVWCDCRECRRYASSREDIQLATEAVTKNGNGKPLYSNADDARVHYDERGLFMHSPGHFTDMEKVDIIPGLFFRTHDRQKRCPPNIGDGEVYAVHNAARVDCGQRQHLREDMEHDLSNAGRDGARSKRCKLETCDIGDVWIRDDGDDQRASIEPSRGHAMHTHECTSNIIKYDGIFVMEAGRTPSNAREDRPVLQVEVSKCNAFTTIACQMFLSSEYPRFCTMSRTDQLIIVDTTQKQLRRCCIMYNEKKGCHAMWKWHKASCNRNRVDSERWKYVVACTKRVGLEGQGACGLQKRMIDTLANASRIHTTEHGGVCRVADTFEEMTIASSGSIDFRSQEICYMGNDSFLLECTMSGEELSGEELSGEELLSETCTLSFRCSNSSVVDVYVSALHLTRNLRSWKNLGVLSAFSPTIALRDHNFVACAEIKQSEAYELCIGFAMQLECTDHYVVSSVEQTVSGCTRLQAMNSIMHAVIWSTRLPRCLKGPLVQLRILDCVVTWLHLRTPSPVHGLIINSFELYKQLGQDRGVSNSKQTCAYTDFASEVEETRKWLRTFITNVTMDDKRESPTNTKSTCESALRLMIQSRFAMHTEQVELQNACLAYMSYMPVFFSAPMIASRSTAGAIKCSSAEETIEYLCRALQLCEGRTPVFRLPEFGASHVMMAKLDAKLESRIRHSRPLLFSSTQNYVQAYVQRIRTRIQLRSSGTVGGQFGQGCKSVSNFETIEWLEMRHKHHRGQHRQVFSVQWENVLACISDMASVSEKNVDVSQWRSINENICRMREMMGKQFDWSMIVVTRYDTSNVWVVENMNKWLRLHGFEKASYRIGKLECAHKESAWRYVFCDTLCEFVFTRHVPDSRMMRRTRAADPCTDLSISDFMWTLPCDELDVQKLLQLLDLQDSSYSAVSRTAAEILLSEEYKYNALVDGMVSICRHFVVTRQASIHRILVKVLRRISQHVCTPPSASQSLCFQVIHTMCIMGFWKEEFHAKCGHLCWHSGCAKFVNSQQRNIARLRACDEMARFSIFTVFEIFKNSSMFRDKEIYEGIYKIMDDVMRAQIDNLGSIVCNLLEKTGSSVYPIDSGGSRCTEFIFAILAIPPVFNCLHETSPFRAHAQRRLIEALAISTHDQQKIPNIESVTALLRLHCSSILNP